MPVAPSTTGYTSARGLLKAFLGDVIGYTNISYRLPTNAQFLATEAPLIVVDRFGGADRVPGIDVARLDVDVFSGDETAAESHAETIRQAIRIRLPGWRHSGSVVAKTETMSAPSSAPFDSKHRTFRQTAAYQITLHKYLGV